MSLKDLLATYGTPSPSAPTLPARQTQRPGVGPRQGLPAELAAVERFMVGFSGGKDSLAAVLHLLEIGVPASQIELWHHAIDPEDKPFMDWPITHDYCRAFAKAFGLTLLFSGRVGGFEREMLRDNALPSGVFYETPDGGHHVLPSVSPTRTTRLRFPQVGAIDAGRWCSAILKIDVARRIFNNDPRLTRGTWCLVTGERAQESKTRAAYAELETHDTNNRGRTVFQWRPVHAWPEEDVWAILERHRVNPHPAYRLGFGRVSCMSCIFANRDQWATLQALSPKHVQRIADYEARFGHTIDAERGVLARIEGGYAVGKRVRASSSTNRMPLDTLENALVQASGVTDRKRTLDDAALDLSLQEALARLPADWLEAAEARWIGKGWPGVKGRIENLFRAVDRLRMEPNVLPRAESFLPPGSERIARESQGARFTEPIRLAPGAWTLPAGAFRHDGGPT